MKRLLLLGAGSALMFMMGGTAPAQADNGVHVKGAGIAADGCAGCHRAHSAGAGSILKQAQPGLCYTCHGTTGTGASTDVQGGNGYAPLVGGAVVRGAATGALRGGGFETARINSAAPSGQTATYSSPAGNIPVLAAGVATTSSHSLDPNATNTAWGNGAINAVATAGASVNLTCGSCHDPHGNGNYRILKPVPTSAGTTSNLVVATPVTISDEAVKTYTTANYWNVADTSASTVTTAYIANVAGWCTTCHTRYNANGQGSTNSGDAIYAYRHTSNVGAQGRANCIQCHVSHGSNAAMTGAASAAAGKLNPGGSVNVLADSKLLRIDNRGTCQMCHNK